MQTFIPDPPPNLELPRQRHFKVDVVKFGDGYEQRGSPGLNAVEDSWSLLWEYITVPERNQIETFLDSHAGHKAFLWTPPTREEAHAFVCATYATTQITASLFSIQAEFRRVYEQ